MSSRLYKRGRIWWTWFYDDEGKRHDASTKRRDKRAAALVARRYERSAAAEAHPTRDPTTLKTACDQLRVDRRNRGRAQDTISYYNTKLGHLVRVLGDETHIETLTAEVIDGYIAKCLAEGASRNTVGKELRALGGVLRLAQRRQQFSASLESVLPHAWEHDAPERGSVHSLEQATCLVDTIAPKRAAHVAYLYVSGARLAASHRAERIDFDLEASLLRVRGTKTKRAARTVPIFEHVAELAVRAFIGAAADGPAFEPWGNVRRDLAVACRAAGVPIITPNGCRRSASTWLIERGAPSSTVAYFLGHTTSRLVEQVYGRVDGARLAEAFAAVGIRAAHLQLGAAEESG